MKLRFCGLALLVALAAYPAFGQGCAMCYSSAAAAGKNAQRAVSRAVLVLLVPPLGFMTVGLGMAFGYSRKRDRENDSNSQVS